MVLTRSAVLSHSHPFEIIFYYFWHTQRLKMPRLLSTTWIGATKPQFLLPYIHLYIFIYFFITTAVALNWTTYGQRLIISSYQFFFFFHLSTLYINTWADNCDSFTKKKKTIGDWRLLYVHLCLFDEYRISFTVPYLDDCISPRSLLFNLFSLCVVTIAVRRHV